MAYMNPANTQVALITIRIKEKRIMLNYTQAYIAGKLKISQNAYSKLEAGHTSFTLERLYQIADVLQTDVVSFIK